MPPAELDRHPDPGSASGLDVRPASQPLRVLLVEDNPDDAVLIERHLRRNGFTPSVTRAETVAEMQTLLRQLPPPDVVLADYNLPNFSGPAALQTLKLSGLDIPFIMMSGAVSEETAVESMRAGAQDYVTKQNLVRLIPALERELKEASARRLQVAAERALRASEARFHRLVESMPLGLLISENSGKVIYSNAALERLLGYPSSEIIAGLVSLADLCPTLSNLQQHLTSHPKTSSHAGHITAEPFQGICISASGQSIDVLIGIAVLNPEVSEAEQQLAAFIADLSLQKKSEEVLRRTEKLAVAGRLAASIAHEINNPLEAITNCLYLVEQSVLPEETRSYLELAQKELNRVAQITVQTLRFYRRSSRPTMTDIHELINTVLTLLDSRLRRQNIQVTRDLRPIPLVMAHEGEIRQVLANLVGNAIDALAPGGRITLRKSASHDWRTGRPGIRITVADNGSGMAPETLRRIFEPFFSTKGITGTGLGLWVSHEIIERHHGRITVRSRQATPARSGGTAFTLFLPIENDLSEAPAADLAPA